MYDVKVDKEKCVGCGECVEICPVDVYEIIDEKSVPVNAEECLGCESGRSLREDSLALSIPNILQGAGRIDQNAGEPRGRGDLGAGKQGGRLTPEAETDPTRVLIVQQGVDLGVDGQRDRPCRRLVAQTDVGRVVEARLK